MTTSISSLVPLLFILFLLGSVFVLCICAVAQSAVSQVTRSTEAFFALSDVQSGRPSDGFTH